MASHIAFICLLIGSASGLDPATKVPSGFAPFMAFMEDSDPVDQIAQGSAVVIDESFLLTSALSLEFGKIHNWHVVVGVANKFDRDEMGQVRNITQYWIHPGYKGMPLINDIAVIKLDRPLSLKGTEKVAKILPLHQPGQNFSTNKCEIYGYTMDLRPSLWYAPNQDLVSDEECKAYTRSDRGSSPVICTKNALILYNDWGGALIQDGNMIGINSVLLSETIPMFSVFTDVRPYVEWIRTIIQQNRA